MSDTEKSAKAIKAEETIDAFLNSPTNVIGSKEEKDTIELMRKLPSGVDEKKLFDALKRMGPLQLFRFASSFPAEYIPVLREVMRIVYLNDTFPSRMMNQCLAGGCPILNTAADCDDSNPLLYQRVRSALVEWHQHVASVVTYGVKKSF